MSHVAAGQARQPKSKEPAASELNPHEDRPQSATETVFYENDIVLKDLQDGTIYIFDVIGVVSTGTDERHVLAETEGGATRKKGFRAWNRTLRFKPQRNNITPELQLTLWNHYFRAGPPVVRAVLRSLCMQRAGGYIDMRCGGKALTQE